jgi:hypothetical protein
MEDQRRRRYSGAGLKRLIMKSADGHVSWRDDPATFLDDYLPAIVRKFRVVMDAYRGDAQKIGKNAGTYDLVLDAFETELLKHRKAA